MNMSALWQRFVALSDPQLTADFQKLCGIKVVKKADQQNGVVETDKIAHSSVSSNENGLSFSEECRESHLNGEAHLVRNGTVPYQNGGTDLNVISLTKRQGRKNGFVNHCELDKEDKSSPHLQNGRACQCQHESPKPRDSGFVRNGDARKSGTSVGKDSSSDPNMSYVIENKLLYYIFTFGASLGNDVFYIMFFTIGHWAFDSYVSRKTSISWCVIMYVGQAAKDLICWPRPKSPPAIRLERRYELEYGMPSTHAMVGVVIPFGMLYYTYGYYEYNLLWGTLVATVWCVLVSFSRLYLGMHSVLDIVVGIACAFFIMALCLPFVDMVDCLLMAHPWGFPLLNILVLGLCLAYPKLKVWSTARGDTTQVLAVFSGIYQGLWLTARTTTLETAAQAAETAYTGWDGVWAGLGRQLLGVLLMVVLLESLKKGVVYVAATLQGLDPRDPTVKQRLWVELPYKYIGYFSPAFGTTYLMPRLFLFLGWHRAQYLFEVHNYSHYFGL